MPRVGSSSSTHSTSTTSLLLYLEICRDLLIAPVDIVSLPVIHIITQSGPLTALIGYLNVLLEYFDN